MTLTLRASFLTSFFFTLAFCLVFFACSFSGCGVYGIDPPPARSKPEVGQAVLKITSVPEDVRCIRITAAGTGRTEVREFDAAGVTELNEPLNGLPIGTVTFTGDAFTAACTSVSKNSIAGWASAPVMASLVSGRLANVTLVMTRNGRARIDVSFSDEAACTAIGQTCRIASECCSRRCLAGACASPDAGP